ncbi:MAG: N-acetylmuramoyl-L-alanine amidase family protein [Ignavibacteriales bacterium]
MKRLFSVLLILFLTISTHGFADAKTSTKSKSTSKAKQKIVVIDPGHGGSTAGAKYGGIKEKDLNLDVSRRLYSLLKSKGIKVYLTRKGDSTLSLSQRYNFANSVKASLFVSVHHNALPNNKTYKGTETLYSPSSISLKGMSSKKLANIAQTELVKRLGTINRGIISRPRLAVLRHTNMPSIIAEIGYMTNKNERARIKNSSFKQKSAEALCSAVLKALNQMN